jgi:excisionase family DNA binding protein
MHPTTMEPPKNKQARADLGRIAELRTGKRGLLRLTDASGEVIPLPGELFQLLVQVAGELRAGNSVVILSAEDEMTPQTAADFLGMSRQFLMRLLDKAELPFHKVGAHRRILRKDVETYAHKRAAQRSARLERLRDMIQAAGLDD